MGDIGGGVRRIRGLGEMGRSWSKLIMFGEGQGVSPEGSIDRGKEKESGGSKSEGMKREGSCGRNEESAFVLLLLEPSS